MKFIGEDTEEQIFKMLISRETTFTVGCIEFREKIIIGTVKERERKCKSRAKILCELVHDC